MDVVAQSRVWNWVIDVVAWCGHYKPTATNLQNDFVVEREQHYWVHPPSVAAATYGEAGVAIKDLSTEEPDLEDVFMALTYNAGADPTRD